MRIPIDINNISINSEIYAVSISMTNLDFNKKYKIKEIIYLDEFDVYQFILFKMGNTRYNIYRFNIDITELRKQKLNKILDNA